MVQPAIALAGLPVAENPVRVFPCSLGAVSSMDLVLPEKKGHHHAVGISKQIIWALQGRVLPVEGEAERVRGTRPASLEGKQ